MRNGRKPQGRAQFVDKKKTTLLMVKKKEEEELGMVVGRALQGKRTCCLGDSRGKTRANI